MVKGVKMEAAPANDVAEDLKDNNGLKTETTPQPTQPRIITVNPVNPDPSGSTATHSGSHDKKTAQNGKVSVTLSVDCIQNLIQVRCNFISRLTSLLFW